MSPADIIRALWERMASGDWEGGRALLADDFTSYNPATGEQYTSADSYIAHTRTYPTGWTATIEDVLREENRVAARVRLVAGGKTLHCLSFADVTDGRITRSEDYWLTDRRDPPRSADATPTAPGDARPAETEKERTR